MMLDKILSAIFLPAILVVFFTRVTYSRLIAILLTTALAIVSAYNGYLLSWWIIVIEAASITVGLMITNRMMNHKEKEKENTS